MQKRMRELLRRLDGVGVSVLACDQAARGGHYKLSIDTPAGPRTVTVGSDPPEHEIKRTLSRARRLARRSTNAAGGEGTR